MASKEIMELEEHQISIIGEMEKARVEESLREDVQDEMEHELQLKDEEINKLSEKLNELKEARDRMNQQVKGIKSGIAR